MKIFLDTEWLFLTRIIKLKLNNCSLIMRAFYREIDSLIPFSKQELCLGFLMSVMFQSNRNFRFSTAISGFKRYTQLMRISHCPVFFFLVSLSRCSARKETLDAAGFLFSVDWNWKCADFNFPTIIKIFASLRKLVIESHIVI